FRSAAVLGRARRHLGGTQPRAAVPHSRRVRRIVRWAAVAAAAAAMLVVAGIQAVRHGEPRAASRPAVTVAAKAAPAASEDLNHDGRVDILDAFLLARRLQAAGQPKSEWDFTRDGVVDRRDVDAVAMSAVRLDRGTLH
ncbi:MAG: dockerin type I domain-containing protein, partial [Planctomycetota bacterium]|nr:dockerin type I domain-containing protein [Planctomycetota bacterium]